MSRKAMIDVVIVDDNAVIRYSVKHLISSSGLSIAFEAENGKVCIDKMMKQSSLPDVIILDLEMPVMDGFEAAVVLKRNWPDIRIIAFSGRDDIDSMNRSLNAGADYFVSKNRELSQLITAIKELCSEIA